MHVAAFWKHRQAYDHSPSATSLHPFGCFSIIRFTVTWLDEDGSVWHLNIGRFILKVLLFFLWSSFCTCGNLYVQIFFFFNFIQILKFHFLSLLLKLLCASPHHPVLVNPRERMCRTNHCLCVSNSVCVCVTAVWMSADLHQLRLSVPQCSSFIWRQGGSQAARPHSYNTEPVQGWNSSRKKRVNTLSFARGNKNHKKQPHTGRALVLFWWMTVFFIDLL